MARHEEKAEEEEEEVDWEEILLDGFDPGYRSGPTRERPEDVAEQDAEIVGVALWFLNFSTWRGVHGIYLEDLYVRPEARGGGHGKALLRELARICVERGYERLEWSVLNWNAPSIAFYEAMGARPQDEWTVYRLTDGALADLGSS